MVTISADINTSSLEKAVVQPIAIKKAFLVTRVIDGTDKTLFRYSTPERIAGSDGNSLSLPTLPDNSIIVIGLDPLNARWYRPARLDVAEKANQVRQKTVTETVSTMGEGEDIYLELIQHTRKLEYLEKIKSGEITLISEPSLLQNLANKPNAPLDQILDLSIISPRSLRV